jgi:hypothetical protein
MQVVIDQDGFLAQDVIVFRCYLESLEAVWLEETLLYHLGFPGKWLAGLLDECRRIEVVNQRVNVAESVRGKQLFRVKGAIGFSELGMALMGYLAQAMVLGHAF